MNKSGQQPWIVYTPASPLRRPLALVRDMFHDLKNSRGLAWRLFSSDLSAQYRVSILGYFWVFIPPLVASLPFIYLNSQGIIKLGQTAIPYAAYALIGTVLWQVFVDALNAPLRTVLAARPMLIRINLPREAILLSALAQVLFSASVRLTLVVVVLAWFQIVPPSTVILFPIGVIALILVGFVLGVLLTPFGMLYGDVSQALPVFTTFLMLLTPVVYPVPQDHLASLIAAFNPLTPLITVTRDWLAVGHADDVTSFFLVLLVAALCLLFGWVSVRVAMPHIIARAGT